MDGAKLHFVCLLFISFLLAVPGLTGFPNGSAVKNLQCRRRRRPGFGPWVGNIPLSRKWQPTPVFLSGKSHGQRSLESYSPWVLTEMDMTEAT